MHPIRQILLALDGSERADRAMSHAVAVARACGACLVVARVLERSQLGSPGSNGLDRAHTRALAERHLDAVIRTLQQQGVRCEKRIEEGDAADAILGVAHAIGVDLIVVATHGSGRRAPCLVGATAERILELAECSVLVVPVDGARPDASFGSIVALLDGSKRAECVLPLVRRLGADRLLLARLIGEPEVARRSVTDCELAARLTARNCAAAKAYLRTVAAALPAMRSDTRVHRAPSIISALRRLVAEERPDLLVLAAHGRSGDPEQRHGSIAFQLLRAPAVPTLVVQDRAPDRRPNAVTRQREIPISRPASRRFVPLRTAN